MVALDAVRLLLADVEPALRDQLGVGRPVVRAVETGVPALHPFEQSAQGGGITTAAFPVNHPPCSTTPSVMTWIEQFAKAYAQKPEPEGRAVVVELDEMWHFLKKAEQALGLEGSGSCYRTDHRPGAGGS